MSLQGNQQNVHFYPLAVAKIVQQASSSLRREIAGFLVGKLSENGTLLVFDAMSGEHQATGTQVMVTEEVMARIAEILDDDGRGLTIVGWYHSHPGLGAHFMSSIDVQTQNVYQSYFSHAVALVVDANSFAKSKKWTDLDMHLYHVTDGKCEEIAVAYITDEKEVIPQLIHALNWGTGGFGIKVVKDAPSEQLERLSNKLDTLTNVLQSPIETSNAENLKKVKLYIRRLLRGLKRDIKKLVQREAKEPKKQELSELHYFLLKKLDIVIYLLAFFAVISVIITAVLVFKL